MTLSAKPPHHIAVVMDGNGRWATKRLLPRIAGHKQGLDALRTCIAACIKQGVSVLTVFAFSSENWRRPAEEVSGLMELFLTALNRELKQLQETGVALHFVGNLADLSDKVRQAMAQAQLATASNRRLVLNVCFNYGGRWDVAQAAAKLASQGTPITEATLSQAMALSHVPDPDLIIRTGAEHRISNFLLWQSAYAEFYFSDKLWPDFDEAALQAAIEDFQRRDRRYGRVATAALPQKSTASLHA